MTNQTEAANKAATKKKNVLFAYSYTKQMRIFLFTKG